MSQQVAGPLQIPATHETTPPQAGGRVPDPDPSPHGTPRIWTPDRGGLQMRTPNRTPSDPADPGLLADSGVITHIM